MATLTGKTAVVTGSTSGMTGICARLCRLRRNMFSTAWRARPHRKERAAIESDSGQAVHSPANMTSPRNRRHDRARRTPRSVDVLVNNAGIQFVSPIEEFPPRKWEAIIAITVVGVLRYPRRGARHEERGWGRSSHTAWRIRWWPRRSNRPCVGQARHRRPHQDGGAGARDLQDPCNCIQPGYVWTRWSSINSGNHEGAQLTKGCRSSTTCCWKRADQGIRHLEQVAALALFLCGDDAARSPAPISRSDGGWTGVGISLM